MCGAVQLNAVELSEHPYVIGMDLHNEMASDRPRRQIDEMPLPTVGAVLIVEITVAVDGDPIEEDLPPLIRRGEEETLVDTRIGRNVDAHPDIVCPLGDGDAELRIELPPTALFLGKRRNCLRRMCIGLRRVRLPVLP